MTTPTPEERALFIGERLEITAPFMLDGLSKKFTVWLSMPDGLNVVEEKMIERGFDIVVGYLKLDKEPWQCCIYREFYRDHDEESSSIKSEAILNAAYAALKREENANNA